MEVAVSIRDKSIDDVFEVRRELMERRVRDRLCAVFTLRTF